MEATADWWARSLGIAALLIALGGLSWNIFNAAVRDRAKLALAMSWGSASSHPLVTRNEWLCLLEVANVGRRSVTISRLPGIEFQTGIRMAFSPFENKPTRLEEGSKATFWMYQSSLIDGIREQGSMPTHITAQDDGGKKYRKQIGKQVTRRIQKLVDEPEASKQHAPQDQGFEA